MLREIVLDTETTGTDHATGDRIVEIGAVELINHVPSGQSFHVYVNPGRPMSEGAFAVHGLSDAFLSDKPAFAALADEVHAFLADATLVIHNAAFDVGFLNAEFARTGHGAILMDRVVDSLSMARRRHPGAANNLDALCLRYGIDNGRRTRHGALLDAELLAEVYIELIGGKQPDLGLSAVAPATNAAGVPIALPRPPRRVPEPRLTAAEIERHAAFVSALGTTAIWRDYLPA